MRKLVFIADDFDHVAQLIAVLLEHQAWCEALGFKDGVEVLAMAVGRRPDICVLDVDMPLIGGVETARKLRAQFPDNLPLFIALTGNAAHNVRHSGVFDHVLQKPLDVAVLVALISGEP